METGDLFCPRVAAAAAAAAAVCCCRCCYRCSCCCYYCCRFGREIDNLTLGSLVATGCASRTRKRENACSYGVLRPLPLRSGGAGGTRCTSDSLPRLSMTLGLSFLWCVGHETNSYPLAIVLKWGVLKEAFVRSGRLAGKLKYISFRARTVVVAPLGNKAFVRSTDASSRSRLSCSDALNDEGKGKGGIGNQFDRRPPSPPLPPRPPLLLPFFAVGVFPLSSKLLGCRFAVRLFLSTLHAGFVLLLSYRQTLKRHLNCGKFYSKLFSFVLCRFVSCRVVSRRFVSCTRRRFSNELDTVMFHGCGNGTGFTGNCYIHEIDRFSTFS